MANLDIESDELIQVSFAIVQLDGQLCLPNCTRTLIINNYINVMVKRNKYRGNVL